MMKWLPIVLLFNFLSCSVYKKSPIHPEKVSLAIEKGIDTLLSYPLIHSAAVGIYSNHKVYMKYFGELDPSKGNPPTAKTVYEIASITKTFTGLLLAQALLDNKLSLEEDIRLYLEGDYANLEYQNHPIRIKDLVSHTSGLPFMLSGMGERWDTNYDSLSQATNGNYRKFLLEKLRTVELDTIPGTQYNYSNLGATVLGYILENVYQTSYETLLKKEILDKLRMDNTKLVMTAKDSAYLARGYYNNETIMPYYVGAYPSARGLKSTLPDLMKYMVFQLKEKNTSIIKSHEKLYPHRNPNAYYSYYWLVNNYPDQTRRLSCHGGAYGTQTWMMFYPEKELGIVIITNQSDPTTGGKIIKVAKNIIADVERK